MTNTNTNTQELRTMEFYCKIPYTEITGTFRVPCELTIAQFYEYCNNVVKVNLNIHSRYDIELVDIDNNVNGQAELARAIELRNNQTLKERYHLNYNNNNQTAIYIRPVNPTTREFIIQNDYNN